MVKYKVNLKFTETSKSLNEIIIEMIKIELQKKYEYNYSQIEGNI